VAVVVDLIGLTRKNVKLGGALSRRMEVEPEHGVRKAQ